MSYDLEDSAIRDMVLFNHRPEEAILVGVDGKVTFVEIACEKDQQQWPCEAIIGLRAWQKAKLDAEVAAAAEPARVIREIQDEQVLGRSGTPIGQ
jgi:hypothetical protein